MSTMKRCKHCGKRIRQSYSKYTLGWTHEGGDAYCRLEFAEPDREVCPQPCEHLSQHDAREGRTCPEHPCTCTDREIRCRCDGGAYGPQVHPFLVHPECPIHATDREIRHEDAD